MKLSSHGVSCLWIWRGHLPWANSTMNGWLLVEFGIDRLTTFRFHALSGLCL